MGALADALTMGYGVERQFRCEVHEDRSASASVNTITGLWVCYACGAAGKVDMSTIEISTSGLIRYVSETFNRIDERTSQRYSESWLNSFDATGPGEYWLSRFDEATARHFRLGSAPGVATYPMRDNAGKVLGVVTRDLTGQRDEKYKYPRRVSTSRYLVDYHRADEEVLFLVEGMSDVAAVHEAGYTALGTYGSKPSDAQAQLLRAYAPSVLFCAYDQDEAGERGWEMLQSKLHFDLKQMYRMDWDTYNDVAAMPVSERTEMLAHFSGKKPLTRLA